ncbi:MAG: cytosol nonspecific dipeptidase, partial [Desulfomonilia bacterium]|nr:cytosol nonspecific dipeptidase [Desulfomonilia bacterium]
MNRLEELKPEILWRFFWEISQIPRASGKEEQIRNYVISTARSFDCAVDTDTSGNVIVKKEGRKEARTVALQAHLDMVCEKNTGTVHNFDEDPISLVRRGDWVMAEGTTLGADNGIGVAAMLAL